MKFTGTKHHHADGSTTVRGHCTSGSAAINLALRRANTLPSYFIPSDQFVGPELPLHAAMRRLITDELAAKHRGQHND